MEPDGLRISRSVVVPERELSERFSRSSGPGGQGVNTADSRVELSFDVARSPSLPETTRARMLTRLEGRLVDGVVTVAASEHRAQLANRRAARERLETAAHRGCRASSPHASADEAVACRPAAAPRREEAARPDQARSQRPLGLARGSRSHGQAP